MASSPDPTVSVPLVSADAAPVAATTLQVAASSVHVTPAQVWSAALQNIVIVAALTLMYGLGKLDQSIWLSGLAYVSGVDLFGRIRLPRSVGGAMAIGATGTLAALGRIMPHAVLLAVPLAFLGCATTLPEKAGDALLKIETAYERMDALYGAVCLPEPVVASVANECAAGDEALHALALPSINLAVAEYTEANDALKDADAGAP